MANEVPLPMPKMSMTMETGELLSWSIAAGDTVKSGDVVAEVQTDKVDMEVESPVDGVVARLVAQPGDVVDVGAPIAFILSEADDMLAGLFDPPPDTADSLASEPATPGSDVPPAGPERNGSARAPKAATPVSRKGPLPAVPLARRRAAELKVSLENVRATGPGGVITVDDVELAAKSGNGAVTAPAASAPPVAPAAAPAAPAPAAPAPTAPATAPTPAAAQAPAGPASSDPGFADALAPRRRAIRSAVARTMTASATIPQFTVFAELDLDAVSRVRGRIGWTTLLMRALARAIRAYPQVNAGWDDAANAPAAPKDSVGVALAADTAVGLLAPVVKDPDLLSLQDQDALIRATIARARTGKLSGPDLQGGTTTLSNLGGFGVPSFTSLLTPPQATSLSAGAINERPMVIRGGLVARLGVTVGLTIDHRPIDGADGARVLADMQELFRNPERLLD
jgi:pyruvate dehydrogenase E2 component (dihydrolipoamide acetyltransferase)